MYFLLYMFPNCQVQVSFTLIKIHFLSLVSLGYLCWYDMFVRVPQYHKHALTHLKPMFSSFRNQPVNIYLVKVNNRNTIYRYEICSKLIIKTPERCHWHRFDVFVVNFEHISHFFPVFSIVDFKQVNVSWENICVNVSPDVIIEDITYNISSCSFFTIF